MSNGNLTNGQQSGNTVLSKSIAFVFFGQVIPLLVGIFSVRLLFPVLGTARFGVLTLVWALIGYAGMFEFGIGRALTKRITEKIGENKQQEIVPLFWTSMALLLTLGCIGSALLGFFKDSLVLRVLNVPKELQSEVMDAFAVAAWAFPFVVCTAGLRGTLEAHHQFARVSLIQSMTGIYMFSSPLVICIISTNLGLITLALVCGRIFGLVGYAWSCFNIFPTLAGNIRPQKEAFQSLWTFSVWISAANIPNPLMVYLDRFVIGTLLSVSVVAYYTTPFDVITKLWIIPSSIVTVLFPAFSTSFMFDKVRCVDLLKKSIRYSLAVLLPICFLLIALAKEGLSLWLGQEFSNSSFFIVYILSIAVLINSLAHIPSAFIQGIGRPDLTTKLSLIQFPIYVPILFFLTKEWGIVGVAVAWAFRVSFDFVALVVVSRRLLPGVSLPMALVYLASPVLAASIAIGILPMNIFWKVGSSVSMAILIILVEWIYLLDVSDRELVKHRIQPLMQLIR